MSDFPKCNHARVGIVTSHPRRVGLFDEAIRGAHAATNVCADPDCIADAQAWVERTCGKPGNYQPDQVRS